jgi:electron transfer flavoprotein beta subunit
MKARSAEIVVWKNSDLEIKENEIGLEGSPTQVVKIFSPPKKEGGKIFQGEPEDAVEELVEEIKDIL